MNADKKVSDVVAMDGWTPAKPETDALRMSPIRRNFDLPVRHQGTQVEFGSKPQRPMQDPEIAKR